MIVHYQGREVSPLVSILESSISWTPMGPRTSASNNQSQLMAWYLTEAVLSFLTIMMGNFTVPQRRTDRFTEFILV